jgi:hypothetical protein
VANFVERPSVIRDVIERPAVIRDTIQRASVIRDVVSAVEAKVMFEDSIAATNRRLLENGDFLITEDSNYRILE